MSEKFDYKDLVHTGPGTLAGRYLRMFWQPVYCSHELAAGRAVPIRIMGEEFALYRGESGIPHLVGFRCPHRGTQLSLGWIEEDCIRCFYHGWKFDGSGQCVEQPAEPKPFANKIRIPSYPVKESLGLIFAYLGEGEPSPFNRYPKFEDADGVIDVVRWNRICNYFNNIDNSLDNSHVRFVHRRHRENVRDQAVLGDPMISVEESDWGIRRYVKYPNGAEVVAYYGMPNINYLNGQVVDPEVKRADSLIYKVPVDDGHHVQFEVRLIPIRGEATRQWLEHRRAERAREASDRAKLVKAVLEGRSRLDDIDRNRTDFVLIEDELAQTGQGVIADRSQEHLGRSDAGVIMLRKLWERELRALAEGRPLKPWTYRPDMVPVYPTP